MISLSSLVRSPSNFRSASISPLMSTLSGGGRNHRYSVATGIFNLRNELSKYYAAQFDVQVDPEEEVICTIGSKEGFSHLCLALLGVGERAIVPAPSYPIHTYSVILAGAGAKREIRWLKSSGWG